MSLAKRTVKSLPLSGKTILLRADYNVPLNDAGEITNDFRLQASIPTLRYLLNHGCKIVIISHLGRPKGAPDEAYSLKPVAARLSELLGQEVQCIDRPIDAQVKKTIKAAPPRSVILLENLRFYPGEKENSAEFAEKLADVSGADYFVQDGFGVAHRAHASTDAITQFLPSVAGLLLEREYNYFTSALESPKRPLVSIIGGAKIADKIGAIKRLIKLSDQVVIGGAMANTFLKYNGVNIGKSVYEPDLDDVIGEIYEAVEAKVGEGLADNFLILPEDVAVAKELSSTSERREVNLHDVADNDYILDIGPRSIERMTGAIQRAQTVIWNGTLGMTEFPNFAHGSARAALALAQSDDISIIGGGDTVGFVLGWDARHGGSFSHVSTGGGATLELISGKKLPGVEALLDA